MNLQNSLLNANERFSLSLRTLYSRYGYTQYKMSKFEEYDLYAKNKDFLISDSVITFTDLNGKLMALKPDVTLSIVKNSLDEPETIQKLYYAENVYRAAKGAHAYKEIMQVGLECIGSVDDYCLSEVLALAAQSLRTISDAAVLDISHLGLLSDVIDGVGIRSQDKPQVLRFIGQKSFHELAALCRDSGVADHKISLLLQLLATTGTPEVVLTQIRDIVSEVADVGPVEQLLRVIGAIDDAELKKILRFDFSVVDDIHYYNGLVFKGFVRGLPGSILSGGQYDRLMRKMKRRSDAVGFAVYMDLLERLEANNNTFDVDVVLLYEDGEDPKALQQCINGLISQGNRVMAQRRLPQNIRCRQLMRYLCGEVEILEDNA